MRIGFLRNQVSTKERAARFPGTVDEELWFGRVLDARALFGRAAPLEIEIGSGKARFLLESARARPAHDFLGIERSLAYYRICRDRVARAGLPQRADAPRRRTALRRDRLAPASVRAFHVYFPDPWPKKRQRKRRLLDGVFLELAASRLEPGGVLRITTDHAGLRHRARLAGRDGAGARTAGVGGSPVASADALRAQVSPGGAADLALPPASPRLTRGPTGRPQSSREGFGSGAVTIRRRNRTKYSMPEISATRTTSHSATSPGT